MESSTRLMMIISHSIRTKRSRTASTYEPRNVERDALAEAWDGVDAGRELRW